MNYFLITRSKGVYDFAWLDRIVDALRADGVECCHETGYGNPIYEGGDGADLMGGFPHIRRFRSEIR